MFRHTVGHCVLNGSAGGRASASARQAFLSAAVGLIAFFVSGAAAFSVEPAGRRPVIAQPPASSNSTKPTADRSFPFTLVVHDDKGKPLRDATVIVTSWDGASKNRPETQLKTGKNGTVTITLPANHRRHVTVLVRCRNYASARKTWYEHGTPSYRSAPVPKSYTFRLRPGISIGGKIVDENGRPIANAVVHVTASFLPNDRSSGPQGYTKGQFRTDRNGNWKTPANVSSQVDSVYASVEHADFVKLKHVHLDVANDLHLLRIGQQKLTLRRGVIVEGIVRGPNGMPVAEAFVGLLRLPLPVLHPTQSTRTDRAGLFRFRNVGRGQCTVVVLANGLAAQTKTFDANDALNSVSLKLTPGKTLRLKIVDSSGKPIEGATLAPTYHPSAVWLYPFYTAAMPYKTGKDGRIVWDGAPENAVTFSIFPPEALSSQLVHVSGRQFTPGEQEHTVTLRPAQSVSIRVVDHTTGMPVSRFRVVPGEMRPRGLNVFWKSFEERHGTNGALSLIENSPADRRVYRVFAKGYGAKTSRVVKDDERKVSLEFRIVTIQGPQGQVVGRNGRPIAGAKIYVVSNDAGFGALIVRAGASVWDKHSASTDAKGRFSLEAQTDSFDVLITSEEGYAIVTGTVLSRKGAIKLRPWSRVEGKLMIGAKPGVNESIRLNQGFDSIRPGSQNIWFNYKGVTDKSGRFVFDKVPSERPMEVSREIIFSHDRQTSRNSGTTHTKKIRLTPGKSTIVKLGGTGRPVVGRLRPPENVPPIVSWHSSMSRYDVQESIDVDPFDPLRSINTFTSTYQFRVERDGSFRIEDLPPGKYELTAELYGPYRSLNGKPASPKQLGRLTYKFTIKPIPGGQTDKPLDLGTLKLK